MTSDRSSIVTSHSGGGDSADGTVSPIPDYETGNEEEDQRLKKLHYAAVEFLKVQSNYVQYLKEMAVVSFFGEKKWNRISKTGILTGIKTCVKSCIFELENPQFVTEKLQFS